MNTFLKTGIFILGLALTQQHASALDIIFPQKNPYSTKSNNTYIMGNVEKGASLIINNKKAKVWHNGAFCYPVSLSEGENIFVLKEIHHKKTTEQTLKITKPQNKITNTKKSQYTPSSVDYKELQYAVVTTDGAPVREKASTSSNRIVHLPKNTVILLEKKYSDWYKINTGNKAEQFWIYSKNVQIKYPVNNRIKVCVRNAEISEDSLFSYLKINFDIPILFKAKENGKSIELTLYGIKDFDILCSQIKKQKTFEKIHLSKDKNDNLVIKIDSSKDIWGYNVEYQGNTLIFKKRKPLIINQYNPLRDITVAIDAGHGGKEKGTIGPTRIPEKDVNLAISKYLKEELQKRGANVVMTREDDSFVDLYARPEIAKHKDALICISIHANSMVDGNPLERHGVSVFYYNEHAKLLADTIKTKMASDLKLKDDGTRYSSFVLTRPTMPVSVLIETAYMPNPDEYLKLTNKHFQQKTAKTIADGLEDYLYSTIQKEN